MINNTDINFISRQIKLKKDKVLLLTEEESDLDLILEQIVKKHDGNIPNRLIEKLSTKISLKLIVFSLAFSKNYDISEKSYIANTLLTNLPVVLRKHKKQFTQENKDAEPYCQYYLTCLGVNLNNKSVKKYDKNKILEQINTKFRQMDKRDIVHHLDDWLEIINKACQNKKIRDLAVGSV